MIILDDYVSFAVGVVTTLVVVGAVALYRFVRAPSVEEIETTCTQPLPHMGNDDEITVYGLQEQGENVACHLGVTDASPFVMRVEAYLRLIRQPYVKKGSKGGYENPRRKVPFCNIQGTMVDDSGRIIETLQNTFSVTIDNDLSEEQRTTGYLVQQLLFGNLYWVLLHQSFNTTEGRSIFAKNMAKESMPALLKRLVIPLVIKTQNLNLYGCGVGRMSHAEIIKMGQQDLRVLSTVLGNKQYILGTKTPTSYDTDVYAFLAILFHDEAQCEHVWVKEIQEELPNLVDYVTRMKRILYLGVPTVD